MGWFDKYCEICGIKVDKKTAPQRFGKYFCSEKHAELYASDMGRQRTLVRTAEWRRMLLRKPGQLEGAKMKVQILTTPYCTGCKKVEEMLDRRGVKYELVDVTQNPKILEKYPILSAPGIVIDGKLEFTGVPGEKELKKKLGV